VIEGGVVMTLENEDDRRSEPRVLIVATSRDKGEAYLDVVAARAEGLEDDEADAEEIEQTANGSVRELKEWRAKRATDRRVFMALRKRDRTREALNSGGLLTRAALNALERRKGPSNATWGQFLRSKQRSMQRLPPGTSSTIRLASTRCIKIEHERISLTHPVRSTGRKRAVCVGVNYEECEVEEWRLRRRGLDAIRMRNYLKNNCGFDDDDDLMVLIDDSEATSADGAINRNCSKRAILKACRWLVDGVKAGDSLLFYFSGRDQEIGDVKAKSYKGLEKTALCASDTPSHESNRISRRELRHALFESLPRDVHLTLFLDIFGGGGESALGDLPHSCVRIQLPEEKEIKDALSGKQTAPMDPLWMLADGAKALEDFRHLAEDMATSFHDVERVLNECELIYPEEPKKEASSSSSEKEIVEEEPPDAETEILDELIDKYESADEDEILAEIEEREEREREATRRREEMAKAGEEKPQPACCVIS
jgi:hypothetical protein